MQILQINSSSRAYQNGAGSHSTRLAGELVQRLRQVHPGAEVTVRDLRMNPHPVLDEAALQALFTPAEHRSPAQAARVAQDDELIDELLAADLVVLAAPMYNFGVPAQLKVWIDAVSRAGKTFRYTEKGPIGLVTGKTVYVVQTSGGMHRGSSTDQVTPYLRTLLGFLGMTDVRFVYAEGLAMGPQAEQRAIDSARAEMDRYLSSQAIV